MFLPQMQEFDVFDAHGNQQDDINSLTEYVDQVLLGNTDDSPEDEDDDTGQNFHLTNAVDYFYHSITIELLHKDLLPSVFIPAMLTTVPAIVTRFR